MDGPRFFRHALLLVLIVAAVGCGEDEQSPVAPPAGTVEIHVTSDPTVAFDVASGKTTVITQFIARDRAGNPLAPEDVIVELLLDGQAVDNESLLQEGAEELSSSIHLALVLDASYSMLLHDPPAFGPMRTAARDAIVAGQDLYAGRPGTFSWAVSWFNETIASPTTGTRPWQPNDVLTIPEPGAGTATKLFAAVEDQAGRMLDVHETTANGPHDHHVMVVLSDGADNYSWFDNSAFSANGTTTSGAAYEMDGWPVSDTAAAEAAIGVHPNLTVHVLGLGSSVQDSELQALADAGGGRYLKNPSSSQVGDLFDEITQEFATIQDHGATIPLPPGDYRFTLRVLTGDRRAKDEHTFHFHGGDDEAAVLP
jgi:hypothetical protein